MFQANLAFYLSLLPKEKTTNGKLDLADNLVYVGLTFLSFGMLFGALWAKETWG